MPAAQGLDSRVLDTNQRCSRCGPDPKAVACILLLWQTYSPQDGSELCDEPGLRDGYSGIQPEEGARVGTSRRGIFQDGSHRAYRCICAAHDHVGPGAELVTLGWICTILGPWWLSIATSPHARWVAEVVSGSNSPSRKNPKNAVVEMARLCGWSDA